MKRLKPKGQVKRKEFYSIFKPGMYFYCEFMNTKNLGHCWGPIIHRNMTPRPVIMKVLDKNTADILYVYNNKEDEWEYAYANADRHNYTSHDRDWWSGRQGTTRIYNHKKHMLWNMFLKDELRNIKTMTKEEFMEEYFLDVLMDVV